MSLSNQLRQPPILPDTLNSTTLESTRLETPESFDSATKPNFSYYSLSPQLDLYRNNNTSKSIVFILFGNNSVLPSISLKTKGKYNAGQFSSCYFHDPSSISLDRAFPLLFLLSAPPVLLPWRGTHTSRPRPRPANPYSSSSRSWFGFYLALRSKKPYPFPALLIHPTSRLESQRSSGKYFV